MSDPETEILPEILDVTLPTEAAGERLDRALAAALPDLSRTRIQALVRAGKVTIEGRLADDPGKKIAGG